MHRNRDEMVATRNGAGKREILIKRYKFLAMNKPCGSNVQHKL